MRRIVLIDLDKTLIDSKCQTNVPTDKIRRFFKAIRRKGLTIGISSDSSAETIATYMSTYGLKGPIIAEKGAHVTFKLGSDREEVTVKDALPLSFVRDNFVGELLNEQRVIVVYGDVNELSRSVAGFHSSICYAEKMVLINGSRKASLSCYVYKKDESGGWYSDRPILRETHDRIMSIINRSSETLSKNILVDVNINYGICIIHHKRTKKALALPVLRRWYPNHQIFVIGDSLTDYYGDSRVLHCAVGNADMAFKKLCWKTVKKVYTEGVLELLDEISSFSE